MKFDRTVSTTCPYCGVGCQIDLNIKEGRIISAKASEGKAPNFGRLCVKGRFGTDYTHHPTRLTKPLIRKDLDKEKREPCGMEGFREASWDEALDMAADRISRTFLQSGSSAFGTFCCAKATNEDNYLFQKFVRSVLKTNNIDHCARLCHAASVAGLQKALGSAAMSNSIAEMKDLDLFIVTGSNTTETHPVISTYLKEAVVKNNARLIVIDPRKIEMANFAILHIQHKPGTDVAVYQAMAHVIVRDKLYSRDFIDRRTEGFEQYSASLDACTPQWAEKITGVTADKIEQAARLYGEAEKAAFYWGMGISQSVHGTDNTLSIANLALMCGHLGKPGTGVNPLRGQNNVQGCSDSGGLPNIYPGYQNVADEESALKFEKAWGTDLNRKPGLTTLEMSDAIGEGIISDFIIMGENPLMSEPDLNKAREHLSKLKNMIVIDIFLNETGQYADVILPAAAFSEKNGTFTNSDRRVQLVRKALDPPGEAREDWQIISELAKRVGRRIGQDFSSEFNFSRADEIWDEMAELVPAFGGISHERIEREDGIHWPCPDKSHRGSPYLFSDSFPRGKGKFHELKLTNLSEQPDDDFPYILSTGRVLYHWHGGTMTRRSVLNDISPRPFVEIHPDDARKENLDSDSTVRVSSRRGSIELDIRISDRSPTGVLFIPIHFAEAAVNELTRDIRDASAKIPDYKICAVKIEKGR
ncbi:formate dehydrogenase subunit alpha [Spirochaeta isovalerica]|uniref:nitrate reductase (cytochrome) n=1 Tax=Spirochaeta isovalerica TaxID=150 RepID=A0A841R7J8_9SPIO|nr:formate dehydrogenase subunit alpha [Spirochaeta isovalerica]MBB6478949.1 formate dehydrogenase alpha subunit [Spirochaeta isovalerica]